MIREKSGLREYLISHTYAAIGAIAVFDLFVTHRVSNPFNSYPLNEGTSLLILLTLSALLVFLGAMTTFRAHRGAVSIMLSCAIPLEIYSLLCIWPQHTRLALAMLCALAVSAALLAVLAAILAKNKPKPLVRALKGFAVMLRPVAALLLLPFLVLTVAGNFLPKSAAPQAGRFDLLLSENTALLETLSRERWTQLATDERAAALQLIIELEAAYLGTPGAPQVVPTALDGLVRGQYHPLELTISIDDEWLAGDEPARCVNTVLHEMYHYYQFCMAEALASVPEEFKMLAIFAEAAESAANFGNYKSDGDDYFAQPIEVNARAYADERILFYIELIDGLE